MIQNADSLGHTPARRDICRIIEAGLSAIDTTHIIRSSLAIDGTLLSVRPTHALVHTEGRIYDLSQYERIFIVGCGKVACTAAGALEELLGNRIRDGAVVGLSQNVCEIISTYKGSHPRPSAANFEAAKHMKDIGAQVTERDLVIAVISGGGSAMLCSSDGECDQGQQLYDAFLPTGGTIDEMNIVRRHISDLKGGGLAKALYPATILGLVFSDVPGGSPETVASGPTYFDTSTNADAQRVIDKYNLGAFMLTETPKDPKYFERVTNILVCSNETALYAMAHEARTLGYAAILPQCDPYAPSEDVVACMIEAASARSAVFVGGEPRLAVPQTARGDGGRCGYTALVAVDALHEEQVFAAVASDGHDNSDNAGALADTTTKKRASVLGITAGDYRASLASNTFFRQTDDLITTGPLESNVSDLFILVTV